LIGSQTADWTGTQGQGREAYVLWVWLGQLTRESLCLVTELGCSAAMSFGFTVHK